MKRFPIEKVKLLYLVGMLKEIRGRKKFQKLVFLSKMRKWDIFPYRFIIYFNGPYSEELKDVIDDLVVNGYLKEKIDARRFDPYDFEDRCIFIYSLTKKGKDVLKRYRDKISTEDKDVLGEVIRKYGGLSGEDLEELSLRILGVKKKSEVFEKDVEEIIKARRPF